ncbi:replicative DNA helicase [Desulfuromonas acetoxidans]|uniref:Replicative DNA helicase n=1 Tax=Desulfuromonas acetoxidans (strain DSM 684 / 11070) TaxID=281689 RepID=Q1JY45_DESA6|nr:replicative DNA helicase [Desulfuromonas acetoxidans]EAT15151.1 replicative DNA helicase [Desulfuromonas acetoxidans DSM 684]MBF0643977.1 replicative DNA helicase [Desulfuromonas acetoxidans]NVD23215.1 replicative DNA helicase [Desulfuromonas acetoxidans]NVE15544.1 replicative DNA helicase [Desulfuromonas acetoxidans]
MTEIPAHRLPPQNLEAEMSVLGGILLENDALNKALELLIPDDFYRESHRQIFLALIALSERNEPADLVTLTAELKQNDQLNAVGGSSYLASLVDYVPTAANITYYAKLMKEKAVARHMINVATEIASRGYEGQEMDKTLDWAEKSIFEISSMKTRPSYFSTKEIMKDTFKAIEKLYERKELVTGVPTGYTDLDTMTAGLQPGDLVIVAGRPSMGKTAFCLNVVEYAAMHSNNPSAALVFSLEMGKEQLVQRMLCSVARVDASRLRTGHLGETDWPKLTNGAGLLSEAKIFIDDTPAISVLELRSKARRLKAEHDLGIIVIDYLQLMQGSNPESRQQEISEISRSLKALAKELNVPVIALSQLNRSLENRTDKRPIMADLRESGAIEQDADVIMFVYRESVYCEACRRRDGSCDKGHEQDAEIIIGKQRNGPIGTVHLTFRGQFTRFENQAKREEF